MGSINIEKAENGYILSWFSDDTCCAEKMVYGSLSEAQDFITSFFHDVSGLISGDEFSGFVGIPHDAYPEDF